MSRVGPKRAVRCPPAVPSRTGKHAHTSRSEPVSRLPATGYLRALQRSVTFARSARLDSKSSDLRVLRVRVSPRALSYKELPRGTLPWPTGVGLRVPHFCS